MKVIITVILAIGSAAALGSGPYLPSGWRPQGPAFYLPTENQAKPADIPVKVTLFQENVASGSDSLREYGPPKLQEVTSLGNQGLPDIYTDQIFQTVDLSSVKEVEFKQNSVTDAIIEDKSIVTEKVVDIEPNVVEEKDVVADFEAEKVIITESTAEEVVAVTETVEDRSLTQTASDELIASTPSTVIEENAGIVSSEPEFAGRSLDINIQTDLEEATQISIDATQSSQVTLDEVEATEKVKVLEQENEQTIVSTELNTEQAEVTTVATVIEDLVVVSAENTINTATVPEEMSEPLNKVEEEVVATDLKEITNVAVEGVNSIPEALVKLENEIREEKVITETKAVQDISGSLEQAPEGFLEYGPPGFKEYGPPKEEDVLKVLVQDISEGSGLATNELRRRRFSPKFRTTKKNH